MSGAKRRFGPAVGQQLLEQPQRFGFFQALRLLEQLYSRHGVGATDVHAHRIRFRNSLSLAFAAGEIESLDVEAAAVEGQPPVQVCITPAFIGLLGQAGTLPLAYTERLAEREAVHRDHTGRAFLDIFNQRAVSLFHAAWLKHRPALQQAPAGADRFQDLLLALAGMGMAQRRDVLGQDDGAVFDQSIAHYAGLVRRRPLSAVAMQRVLADHFGLPLRVEQFVGAWYPVPVDQQTRLGQPGATLGRGALCGDRLHQRDLRLRLCFGPLRRRDFDTLLPGAPGARALARWVGLLGGIGFEYEVRLLLHADDVRPVSLCGSGGRLGLDAFLISSPTGEPRGDTGYLLQPSH